VRRDVQIGAGSASAIDDAWIAGSPAALGGAALIGRVRECARLDMLAQFDVVRGGPLCS
jgi:hypothetical protein